MSLLEFNGSLTRPCEVVSPRVSFGEGKNKRIVNLLFLVVPCESLYHNDSGHSILVKVDLRVAYLIHESILKNFMSSSAASNEVINVVDLNIRRMSSC